LKLYPIGRDEEDTAWADLIDVTILDQPATDKPADVSPNASPPPATECVSGCENPRKDGEELDRWAKNRRCSGWVRVI
jgi:hypothetical protein